MGALKVRLTPRERLGIERRYTENLEAYDLFLQAREVFLERMREGTAQARTSSWSGQSRSIRSSRQLMRSLPKSVAPNGGTAGVTTRHALDDALELAQRSVALDDGLPSAHMFLGWIHLWRKEHDQAIAEAKRVLGA